MLRHVTFMYYFVDLSVLIRLRNCLAIKTGHISLTAVGIVSVALGYNVFLRHIRPPYYEGESKSKGKIHLTALIEVTVGSVTYNFST